MKKNESYKMISLKWVQPNTSSFALLKLKPLDWRLKGVSKGPLDDFDVLDFGGAGGDCSDDAGFDPLLNTKHSGLASASDSLRFGTFSKRPVSADTTQEARIDPVSFAQQKERQPSLIPLSGDHFENWGESTMADNSSRTDTSTDVDTDDRNQRFDQGQTIVVAASDSSDRSKEKKGDQKTLRRLAQNREAARKSRLRKKGASIKLPAARRQSFQSLDAFLLSHSAASGGHSRGRRPLPHQLTEKSSIPSLTRSVIGVHGHHQQIHPSTFPVSDVQEFQALSHSSQRLLQSIPFTTFRRSSICCYHTRIFQVCCPFLCQSPLVSKLSMVLMVYQAYVQQLENSRMKLTQLEQEFQRARQQGIFISSSADQSHPMGGNGALAFDIEYARWLEEHNRQINELRAAVNAHAGDTDLRIIVDGITAHYDEIFRLKGIASKTDVFHMLSGMWKTPAERCFLWLGGFRSSELLRVT
ncbi:hypothetical protein KSP40_PGU019872 [Platanthera guangdongensis]|uniref:DOG1 domain-containing protein n=1 Tax=Platanthera guangdongensis TaxID=2320717 RepID=A0ABR2LWN4_9ASPA